MAVLNTIQVSAEEPVSPCEILKKTIVKDIPNFPKRVSFAKSRNIEYANTVMSQEECKSLWYTPYDFKKMKEHSHSFARQAVKQDKTRAGESKSYTNIILRAYDECCKATQDTPNSVLSQDGEKDLVFLVGKANSRTGLERIIVRDLAYDKKFRRTEIAKAVKIIQRQSSGEQTSQSVDDLMCLACETVSLPSRLFARHLAQALEASLRR